MQLLFFFQMEVQAGRRRRRKESGATCPPALLRLWGHNRSPGRSEADYTATYIATLHWFDCMRLFLDPLPSSLPPSPTHPESPILKEPVRCALAFHSLPATPESPV